MALISIDSFQPFPDVTGYSTTGTELRVWYSRSFIDSDGVSVQGGNGTTGFYVAAACTVSTSISIASFSVRTTLDAEDPAPQSIQVYARLFSNNQPKAWIFAGDGAPNGWVIPNPTPASSMTYEELAIYNQATVLANPPQTFWTAAETQAYFNSLSPASDASDVTKGITYLSVAPTVAASPIAYGANDTNVTTSTTTSQDKSTAGSAATSNSANISVADSKAVSDSVVLSTLTTTSDSKDTSQSLLISTADSKAVSDSVVISTLTTTTNSKDTSQSLLISTADSKGVSNSINTSTANSTGSSAGVAASTADSKGVSNSLNISVADSKAVSDSVVISTLTTTTNSKITSQSLILSVTTSTANSG